MSLGYPKLLDEGIMQAKLSLIPLIDRIRLYMFEGEI